MFNRRQILVNLSIIFMLVMNALANLLPLNGVSTAEISEKYSNLFVPAGYVFSIWGVIYLGLIAFGVYQSLKRNMNNKMLDEISMWVVFSSIVNGLWIVAWHYNQLLVSVVLMIVILYSIIRVFYTLVVNNKKELSKGFKYFVRLPFVVYLGWISVATIANIAAFLVSTNWNGFGIESYIWTGIVVSIAVVLSLIMSLIYKQYAYTVVILWALVGIYINQVDMFVRGTVLVSILINILYIVYNVMYKRR